MNREPQFQPETDSPVPTPETTEEKLSPPAAFLDYADVFVWSIFALLLVFILLFRLCSVNGSSMENTLYNGELLILNSLESSYEQDDVIVFHLADRNSPEKTLVKRIIATENQTVEINFETGVITNVTKGETYQAEPFPPFIRDMINKGGLMASIKE